MISVWGAPGAPGRTSATLMLGQLFARRELSVCLIDADTMAPSLLQILGVAENASSLVVACRFAERDSLTAPRLMQTVRSIDDRLVALGGVIHSDEWGDVRAAAIAAVVEICRLSFDLTIIDIGSGMERGHPADLLSTRRFEAASSAAAASDALVAIAQATPLGITRLLQHLPSASSSSVPPVALAVAPASGKASASAAVKSLRDYGMQLPIFELPRYSTEELVQVRMRPVATRRKFGRGSDLTALQAWIQSAVADANRSYGDGSTTTAVPT
ncbi:MAG: hypothetical protein Q7L55_09555 [Actinomycetota bacterium]|nr:hypothetical protein [Actinomycetota bacterium]